MTDIQENIRKIEEEERQKTEAAITVRLQRLLYDYASRPECLEDCKVLIERIGICNVMDVVLNNDNLDLYLYILEKRNIIPINNHLTQAISGYKKRWEGRRVSKSRIIEFIIREHPGCVTPHNLDRMIIILSPTLIKTVGGLIPIFYPTMNNAFKFLCAEFNPDLSNDRIEILQYLISQGYRPEYHTPKFNILNIKSFQSKEFIVDWNNLPVNKFIIKNTLTQGKAKCKICGPYQISIKTIEGDCDSIIDWVQSHLNNIIEHIQKIDFHSIFLYNHIFDPLRELPSLQTIAKNVMSANGINMNNPSSLRTVVIGV